jgi:hypothetical protein
MNEFTEKALLWLKENKMIALIGGSIAVLLFFPKLLKPKRRRRRRRTAQTVTYRTRSGRRLPRSVGTRKARSTGTKKPWQVKGSLAAKRRMAQIRRMKG